MAQGNPTAPANLSDRLKALPQYLLPGHLVSRLTYALARVRWPLLKNWLIATFIRHFQVNMEEAQHSRPEEYEHFNAFFTRTLREGVRPIAEGENLVVSPVDGTISHAGAISETLLLQAKGHHYTLQELLGGSSTRAHQFHNGRFVTIYLSPRDYHRIHMPLTGRLREMVHIPGRLFSVNMATTKVIPRLFARNERVISIFETRHGPMALIQVGAVNVGSIETVWAGQVTPPAGRSVRQWNYDDNPRVTRLTKGQEMGRFNMGSTVILLFPPHAMRWAHTITPGTPIRLGEPLATIEP